MKNAVVYLRPWRIAYVRKTGPYESTIPAAWDHMLGWLEKHGLHSPIGRGFGLMRDCPSLVAPDQCRYDACIDLNPFFEERAIRELGVQTLPGGSYVRTRHFGSYDELRPELPRMYETFQTPAGLQIDQRRPLVTIYLDDPRQHGAEDLRADICVPVIVRSNRGEGPRDLAAA